MLLFLAGQVTHGAYKWINPVPRRCVLHNYVPLGRALRWRPGQFREVVEELSRFFPVHSFGKCFQKLKREEGDRERVPIRFSARLLFPREGKGV